MLSSSAPWLHTTRTMSSPGSGERLIVPGLPCEAACAAAKRCPIWVAISVIAVALTDRPAAGRPAQARRHQAKVPQVPIEQERGLTRADHRAQFHREEALPIAASTLRRCACDQ